MSISSIFSSLFREPLLHFVLVAGALTAVFSARQHETQPTIVVDDALMEALENTVKMDPEYAGDPIDRICLVEDYLRQEILYQEGLKRGVENSDRFRDALVADSNERFAPLIAPPSDEELKVYRSQHPERYRYPPRISFEHVSFPKGWKEIPEDLLVKLDTGAIGKEISYRSVRLSNPVRDMYAVEMVRVLGAEAAKQISELPLEKWHGPIASNRGIHYIHVLQAAESRDMPFKTARAMIYTDWAREKAQALMDAKLIELEGNYKIILPEGFERLPR